MYRPRNPASMNAYLVGLAIKAKLDLMLPRNNYKLDMSLYPGSHHNKVQIDK